MIGLANCVFPNKVLGSRLDTLARVHLWNVGKQYMQLLVDTLVYCYFY